MNRFCYSKAIFLIFAGMLFVLSSPSAFPQEKGGKEKEDLTLTIRVQKEVRVEKDGKRSVRLESAEDANKDDTLVYTITYKNRHDRAVKNAAIVDPIPAGSKFVIGTATGKGAKTTYSIDGGETFQSPPVMYQKPDGNGKSAPAPAPASMFTHIKWLIKGPIPPGGTGKVGFKVILR